MKGKKVTMIQIALNPPSVIANIYRAVGLRLPLLGEPVEIHYDKLLIGRGKVVKVDGETWRYDVLVKSWMVKK